MKTRLFCACLFMAVLLFSRNTMAWVEHVEKLASSEPQECYDGFGERASPDSTNPLTCPADTLPYTPQSYVWSLTQYGNSLWFGTGANRPLHHPGRLLQRSRCRSERLQYL